MDQIIQKIFPEVYRDRQGIYVSNGTIDISYRDDGHNYIEEVELDSFWYKYRNTILKEIIKSENCSWLLDVGGGNGVTSFQLNKVGIKTIVLEPGREGVLNAKKKSINYAVQADFVSCKIEPETVENIGCFDVLEHVKDHKFFVKKIYKTLKTNGLLFLTVPAHQFLWSKNDEDVGHYRRYTLNSLSDLLMEEGFEIKYKTYLFWFLPIPILIFRKFFYRKNIEKKKNFEHATNNSLINSLLLKLLNFEKKLINKRRKIPFGSTCLIIAKKN